jgi:hypothetical protein
VVPTWETAVMAAVLVARSGAVASHLTAAVLWDLFDGRPPAHATNGIHLTAARHLRLAGVVPHRRQLDRRERGRCQSVPVTSPARTLFDLGTVLDAGALARCTDEALRRKLLDLRELRRVYELHRGGGRRRLHPLRTVLAERGAGYDPGANDWEKTMDAGWDELGLPLARRQYRVNTPGGWYRLDRALPELQLGVEWVGTEYHALHSRFKRDRIRISDLVQQGWDIVEVTPGWTKDRIRATVLAKVRERRMLADVGKRAG